jgi:hypothetical protein
MGRRVLELDVVDFADGVTEMVQVGGRDEGLAGDEYVDQFLDEGHSEVEFLLMEELDDHGEGDGPELVVVDLSQFLLSELLQAHQRIHGHQQLETEVGAVAISRLLDAQGGPGDCQDVGFVAVFVEVHLVEECHQGLADAKGGEGGEGVVDEGFEVSLGLMGAEAVHGEGGDESLVEGGAGKAGEVEGEQFGVNLYVLFTVAVIEEGQHVVLMSEGHQQGRPHRRFKHINYGYVYCVV